MPKLNGIGVSEATREKQKTVKKIFEKHIYAVNHILNRNISSSKNRMNEGMFENKFNKYVYIDATCGSGKYNEIDGSPLIFLDILSNVTPLIPKTYCYFIDNRLEALQELGGYIHRELNGHLKLIHGEYTERIPKILENYGMIYGLIYFDPNGVVDLCFIRKLLRLYANMNRVDVLFNYNGTAFKRKTHAIGSNERFTNYLRALKKRCWYISKPRGVWQWSFLFGTNTHKLQLPLSYGFYDVFSDEGQQILKQLDLTKNERKFDGQRRLF